MKIMAASFKRSCAHTDPNPAAGHREPMPPPETPGHSQASLGQFLVGSLLLRVTDLEKVSFHSSPKEGQLQRMFKLAHNCTHHMLAKECSKFSRPVFSSM